MTQTILDAQAIAQAELEQYIDQQAEVIAPERIGIDSILDIFGALYRV
ncbi:hypothetical protein [Fischerella sp. PCC 9605]|nr:hypothetical protein [Fischerella sp. PCC 9605]